MSRSFVISAAVSYSLLFIVFIATMYKQYQGVDYPYLAYGSVLIIAVSLVISLLASKLAKGRILVSTTLSAVISLLLVVGLAFL